MSSVGQDAEELAALEQFVVNNDDLLKLEALIGRFNLFDVLDISRAEIKHSNALAFLLDPAESHGQGQLFLKAILMDVLKLTPPQLRPLSPIELDGEDLRGVLVQTEWEHVDLLITCQQPPFVVAIENKVDSSEHSDQLKRYQSAVATAFPGARALYVFLTLTGQEPSSPSWVPYSYADIHRVLSRVRETSHNAIGDDVLMFLDHYLSLVGSRFMNDPTIDELCRRIYKNHRRALQLIYDRVGSPASGILGAIAEVVVEDPRWHHYYNSSTAVDFVPSQWLEWLPGGGLDGKEPRSWLVARFEAYNGKLDFYIEVRRMSDSAFRRRVIDVLIAAATKAGFKARQSGEIRDSYTRICGKERPLEWGEDEAPDTDKVRKAVKSRLDALHPKMELLGAALKPTVVEGSQSG